MLGNEQKYIPRPKKTIFTSEITPIGVNIWTFILSIIIVKVTYTVCFLKSIMMLTSDIANYSKTELII